MVAPLSPSGSSGKTTVKRVRKSSGIHHTSVNEHTTSLYLLELDLESVARVGDLLHAGQYGRVDLVEAVPHLLGGRAQETVDVRAQLLGRLAFHLRPHDQVLRVLVVRLRIRHAARTPPRE